MDLKNYINILWRRKWIILLTLLITMIVVIVGTMKMTPIYSATTTIRVALTATGTVSYQDYMYGDRLMNTYVKLATTAPVLDELKQKAGISNLPSIEVKTIPSTELLQISAKSTDPLIAALAANTLADILIEQSSELYAGSGESSLEILRQQVSSMELEVNQAQSVYENLVANKSTGAEAIQTAQEMLNVKQQMYSSLLEQYEQTRIKESLRGKSISIVDPAFPPTKPSKPNKPLNIVIGFMVGMMGGLGLGFLFENLDTTLHDTEQIEALTKLPIIGKVPRAKKQNSFTDLNDNFAFGEAVRRLRSNIFSTDSENHTIIFASADRQEGKSRIVANLAYTIGQSGRKVVVVDADMRMPSQYKLFNVDNKVGLSTTLEQQAGLREALRQTEFQGVYVLPSGPSPINPSELLSSDQMKALITQLTKIFDIVLIDTPAALAVVDAAVLAPLADAIVLIVKRDSTTSGKICATLSQFNKDKASIIGVVVNRAEPNHDRYYYYKSTTRPPKKT